MIRETDLAWAAGIVDGEGCISLHTVKSSRGNDCYVLRLSVANTSLLMLERLRRIFANGTIHPQKKDPKYKPLWHWEVSSQKAEEVLRLLLPYLVNKKTEAEVGLLSRQYMGTHGVNKQNPNGKHLQWLKTQLSQLKTQVS